MSSITTVVTPAQNVPSSFVHTAADSKPATPADHTVPFSSTHGDAGADEITYAPGTLPDFQVLDRVMFATDGVLPAPLDADKTYYVVAVPGSGAMQVSESIDGDPLDITDTGEGSHTVIADPETLAQIAAYLDLRLGGTGPASPEPWIPFAVAVVDLWKTYFASSDFVTWALADNTKRYKDYQSSITL